jgi:hypothetical protein
MTISIEAGIFPASSKPEGLTTEQLVEIAVGTFQRIQDSMPYIIELRKRFKQAPRGKANIAGCDTWEQFCKEYLHRTASTLRKALQAERPEKPKIELEPCALLTKRLSPLLPLEGDGTENQIPDLLNTVTQADINLEEAEHLIYMLERISKQFADYAKAIRARVSGSLARVA